MTPVGDIALDTLHTTATEIFTGAVEACNIESAFDRRIRFEGNTMHRLLPDGSGPATINLSCYKRIFVVALGKAAQPHEAAQGSARSLLLEPGMQISQLAHSLL
jgi:hydroxypyruvate reductase